jgi:hypothetical protein
MQDFFAHGSNVNFQTSTREMFFSDLTTLLQQKKEQSRRFVVGLLRAEKEQIAVYGALKSFVLNEDVHIFEIEDEDELRFDREQFLLSQEAIFTIEDERNGQIDVTVTYLTYEEADGEIVVFLIDEAAVTHPLACVVQFYGQVKEVGRDVDFHVIGCTANQWKPQK